MNRRQIFHSQLKDIVRNYGRAMDDYERAMQRGDVDRADEAIGDMQTIENSVTIIERPSHRDR